MRRPRHSAAATGAARRAPRVLLPAAALVLAGCAPSARPDAVPEPATPVAMPPIPRAEGPLAIRVTYPAPDQRLTARDSNFIFGSVGHGDARLTIDGRPVEVKPNGAWLAFLPVPADGSYDMVAALGADTVRRSLPIRLPEPRPALPAPRPTPTAADGPVSRIVPGPVQLGQGSRSENGDRLVVARPTPGGTYRWFFLPGTIAHRTDLRDGFASLRLAPGLDVWVPEADVHPLPADTVLAPRVVGDLRVTGGAGHADLTIPMASPAPYTVEQDGASLVLTLYDATANTDRLNLAPGSDPVRDVSWAQLPGGAARYTVHLAHPPFGYVMMWQDGALVLRVRERPPVDAAAPLRGLRIAVDAGHPPLGATGPTGLRESEATLAVSTVLKDELERRGATVVMTRTTMDAVPLGDRPVMARQADAHAFVSIHLNAFPDGVNPFANAGTSTYYFTAHSAALARHVQQGMVRSLGLRDLGVFRGNLAVVRPTWMPSVLAEGAFLMIPEQEAAMRSAGGQRAYARGVADGLEEFFRGLHAEREP